MKILGAGLSGLYLARLLTDSGYDVEVYEKKSYIGGRASTESFEGFLLDRGFQVYLTSYKEGQRAFCGVKYKTFHRGALLTTEAGIKNFKFSSLLNNFPLLPNFLLGSGATEELVAKAKNTEEFIRPFLRGVFLENEFRTPLWFLRFVLLKFLLGRAAIPEKGIGTLAHHLSRNLKIHLDSNIDNLVGYIDSTPKAKNWRGCTTIYLVSEKPIIKEPILVLNSSKRFPKVNHAAEVSTVQPNLSPAGSTLLSVNSLEDFEPDEAIAWVKHFFGEEPHFLKKYSVPYALPAFDDDHGELGDGSVHPSIEGALISARKVFNRLVS